MSERTFGRNREMDVIRRALADTASGAGGCLVLDGPAGIGKSHLIHAATEFAGTLAIAVARREAFKLDLAAPLMTLAGALRRCEPATTEFDWLSRRPARDDQYHTLERLRACMENVAARRPLLVVIDDAHWMDELSALAVRELVPALASSPVRWLFASRPVAPETPGLQTLDWLSRGWTEPISLGVLDEKAVAQLCAEVVGAEVDNTVLALAAGCGGNPLRIKQLLRALRVTDQLVVSGEVATVVGAELPSSFVDTVQEILTSLSAATQRLLRSSSVFARPFSIRTAGRLLRRDPAELFPLIEEALADVLTEEGDGLTFTHDLVRQAVYSTLPHAVREQLHRDAAVITRDEGRPALEVAEHLLRSGRSGTADAVSLLRTAAREVALPAPATAADLMLHALGAVGRHGPDRTALIAEAVGLLASAARLKEARSLGEEALQAGLDAETEAVLLLGLAEASKHAGENENVVRYADRGLGQAGVSEATRARLHAIRAHALFYVGDLAGADASGAESDRLGQAGREYGASVFGLTARSLVAQAQGRLADALQHASSATELADRVRGEALHRHPRIWLGSALTSLDRFDEAERAFLRGRQESERLGTAWAQPLWHYFSASLLVAQGRLDEAAAEAGAGVATAEQVTAIQLAVPLLGILTRLAVLRGDIDEAQSCLNRMHSLMSTGITAAPEDVIWAEATYRNAVKERGMAFAMLSGVYDSLPERPALISHDPVAAATLVALALDAGDRDRAAKVAQAARRLAQRNPGSHAAAGAAAHAEGLLRRDPRLLRRAVEQFRQTPRPLALAAALEDAAVVGRRTEDPQTLQSWYDESLTIVTACGAKSSQQRLEGRPEWRGTAVPSEPGQRPCLPQLSEAERKVALLVAEGLTNIKVAQRLYLSRHTVDSHLRSIFGKLEINRRVELAALVARECRGNRLSA